jgi:hypothetical protein
MNNRQLAIELSNIGVRFSESSMGVISTHELLFSDRQEFRFREVLDDFVSTTGIKGRDYTDYTLSWSMERSTLVPSNIFGESNPVDLFQLCYGKSIPTGQIDYNRIPEQGVVNIFEIADWVKSYVVTRFPRTIIQHEGSHLIRGLFAASTFKLHVLLVPYATYFQLIMAKENKLIYYSTFDYQEIEDVIYHLAFTLQQKELMNTDGRLTISRGIGSSTDFAEQLIERFKHFHDLRQLTVNVDPHFITNAQRLCV